MKILPNHLNIACILVSSGYLVSKGNKDGVALPFVKAPPSFIQEVWVCPGRKWRTWVILVHTEKKNLNMLSKKGVNQCQGCEETIWGLCLWVGDYKCVRSVCIYKYVCVFPWQKSPEQMLLVNEFKSSFYFQLSRMFQLHTSKRKKIYMAQITMTHGYLRVVELGVRYVWCSRQGGELVTLTLHLSEVPQQHEILTAYLFTLTQTPTSAFTLKSN